MTQLTERLDSFEHRLRGLDGELSELRRLARAQEQPEPLRVTDSEAPIWETLAPQPASVPEAQPSDFFAPPQRVRMEPEPFDLTVLLGARALAWT